MTGDTMTTSQVARLLEVSTNTVLRWADEDKVFGEVLVRPSGHRRFDTDRVIAFLDRQKANAAKLAEAKAAMSEAAAS